MPRQCWDAIFLSLSAGSGLDRPTRVEPGCLSRARDLQDRLRKLRLLSEESLSEISYLKPIK